MNLAFGTIAFGLCGSVLGHGNIVWPPVWQDANGTFGLKSGQQCYSGAVVEGIGFFATCNWFTNNTFTTGEPTLPDYMLTYPDKTAGLDKRTGPTCRGGLQDLLMLTVPVACLKV